MIDAWIEAGKDLDIVVIAPFELSSPNHDRCVFVAHLPDFGGPNGALLTILDAQISQTDNRAVALAAKQGYWTSSLGEGYSNYERQLFIDTLNDFGYFGPPERRPTWFTGKPWTE